jgi:hypothetical protein
MRIGALSAAGLALPQFLAAEAQGMVQDKGHRSCILILNVGGPSHLDTFDMKPHAPAEIRGPFRPIATRSAEFQVCELFPRHAQLADQISLIRSCQHFGPAVHDVGWQLMQTGQYYSGEIHPPYAGAVATYCGKSDRGSVVLPAPLGRGGGGLPSAQSGGFLGSRFDPHLVSNAVVEQNGSMPLRQTVENVLRGMETRLGRHTTKPADESALQVLSRPEIRHAFDLEQDRAERERYGRTRFGQSCLLARRLVAAGVRFVTINTFCSVYDESTWDIHGTPAFSNFDQMKRLVAPMYDQAYGALIEDLENCGLLDTTLVCNLCEFGRTPRINAAGGRDHWTRCFTVYFAGGGVQGGRVIGRSDGLGGTPQERPVQPTEILATIYRSLGLPPGTQLPGPDGKRVPMAETKWQPVAELFGG